MSINDITRVYMARPAIEYENLQAHCDRCRATITIDDSAYNCLQCPNFDVCADCAAKGLYCQNDTHDWKRYEIRHGESKRSYMGSKLTTSAGTILRPGSKPYPSIFQPPIGSVEDRPELLFANEHRYISTVNPREILIYTDGACSNNGRNNPQAGCAFVYRPSAYSQNGELVNGGTISFALEARGPTGEYYKHTSNRAELRAVIGALQFRDWSQDCNRAWRSVVIATDSEYVAVNATQRIQRWESEGWVLASGVSVKNVDLWMLLLKEVRRLQSDGVSVSFWRIPREWNGKADEFAKSGVAMDLKERFHRVLPAGPIKLKFKLGI